MCLCTYVHCMGVVILNAVCVFVSACDFQGYTEITITLKFITLTQYNDKRGISIANLFRFT